MEKLANKMTVLLLRNRVIDEQEMELYIYGFQITLANVINALIAVTIGILSGKFLEVLLFYFVFVPARQYAGGYHAKTYGKCFLSFGCCIFLMLVLSSLIIFWGNPWWFLILTYLIYGLAVWKISPCPSEQVCLSDTEKAKYKRISWGILLTAGCVNALLAGFHIDTYSCVITTTIWEVTFLMWLGRRAYEQHEENASGKGSC